MGWQWGGSGMSWTICKSFASRSWQIATPVPHHSVFTVRMPFLSPNQQHQSTEGISYLKRFIYHNCFMALFPGPPRWAGARIELLDFMVQRKIKRGRHTDHPAWHHSIQTNQCPPPPSPYFLRAVCPSCLLTNSVKALKASYLFSMTKYEDQTINQNNTDYVHYV